MKRAPSFPYLTDEYEPTDANLWEKVKEVARGDKESLELGGRSITKPSRYVWPSPPASAWAVKQYNGFGGAWRKKGVRQALRILLAGGIVTTHNVKDSVMMQKLADRGLAKLAHESPSESLWEAGYRLQTQDLQQVDRVTARWKKAIEALDPVVLRKALDTAVHRTRDFKAKVTKFHASRGTKWTVEAVVQYELPASRIPTGKKPLLPVLNLEFEFDPSKALSLRAYAKSPVLGTTRKIYENHRITGDYEKAIRNVLLSYQPEVAWK